MSIRQPFKAGCFTVDVTWPITLATCMVLYIASIKSLDYLTPITLLYDPQIIHQRAAALSRKGEGIGDSFTRGGGDAEGQIAFAAESQPRHARPVFDEQRRIHQTAHLRHVADVLRMDDARVSKPVLELLGQLQGL